MRKLLTLTCLTAVLLPVLAYAADPVELTPREKVELSIPISQCWDISPYEEDKFLKEFGKDATLKFDITINKDKSIKCMRMADSDKRKRYDSDAAYKAYVTDIAGRLKTCKGLARALPSSKYEAWNEMTLNFTPRPYSVPAMTASEPEDKPVKKAAKKTKK